MKYKDDYQTRLKDWHKRMETFVYPEPTIDIKVDGKALHVNGYYKQGMIKEFMRGKIK